MAKTKKKKLSLALIGKIFYWLTLTALILIALGTTFSVLEAPGGYRLFVVQSGSMEPTIKTGSVVIIGPQEEYNERDIVTFLPNPQASLKDINSTVTHRIAAVQDDEGRATFKTKGDANQNEDRETITEKQILGKAYIDIPYLGYAVAFSKTQTGLIVLIVIPGTLIIYSELLNVKKEITNLIRKHKKVKSKKNEV